MSKKNEQKLVLGIGNLLLKDEGVGIHAVRMLEKMKLPENLVLLDGGTGGFHLLSDLTSYDEVILIDAALDNNPPGTIRLIEPRYAEDFPPSLSAHDIGLKDLLDTASVLGKTPKIYLLAISVKEFQEMEIGLSSEVKKTLPEICKRVIEIGKKSKK